ncbi:MAG: hypothetical protein OSB38_28760 [Paraburkholderia fungorum]|nr:hypothetical protein [Paraburkholderia fungorum]
MAAKDSTPVGSAFSRLTVIGEPFRTGKWNKWGVRCKCECGAETVALCESLVSENTRSCGCIHREGVAMLNRKHGRSKDSIYSIYLLMVKRCTDPKSHAYHHYGGRGIKVCERWLESFENFLQDMGERPEGKTLDRFPDVDGNYEPGNCRWATWTEQQNNKRDNHVLEVNGVRKTLSEWAAETGISPGTLWNRTQYGWTPHEIVTVPPRKGRNQYSADR